MKLLATATLLSALAFAAPAHAQLLNSGNSGLLGIANNLLGLQTGHISVLNGGILNGSNLLSGIGLGSSARSNNSATNVTGSGHSTAPGGVVVGGRGNTVVPGSNNVIGTGNAVGNHWGSNVYSRSFNRFGW